MITSANIDNVSEETELPTFYIIPFDAYGQVKVLPDGRIYLITNENQQNEDRSSEAILNTLHANVVNTPKQQKRFKNEPYTNAAQQTNPPILEDSRLEAEYFCFECRATFNTPKEHTDHLKWHRLQKKFKCTKCPATYNIEVNLKIHFELVHRDENTLRDCPVCGIALRFKRAASLKSHMMIHQVEEVYTCEECEAEFEKEDEYSQHISSHYLKKDEPDAPLSCTQCVLQFNTRQELKFHKADHTKAWKYCKRKKTKRKNIIKNQNYACDICNKTFIKRSLLKRHERIHSGERPFQCNICEQSFNQKVTLQNHLLKHTGHKPFPCFLCPARFNQKGNLRVHINKTHTAPQNDQKVFKCSHCSCIFKRIASLNGHVTKSHLTFDSTVDGMVNSVMKNLKDLKNANFESSVTLTECTVDGNVKKYMVKSRKIGDTKWYKCTYCSKMCKKPSDLIRHIRIHTKERPFACKLCERAFSSKSALISHRRTHFSLKKFKCDICETSFKSNRGYSIHLDKHECEKPVKDKLVEEGQPQPVSVINKVPKYVDKTDTDTVALKILNVPVPDTTESTAAKPFHCTVCSARFSKKTNLHRHFQIHEGDRGYRCHLCTKTFNSPYKLKEHTDQHNIKNYSCKMCSKRFATAARLRKHMEYHGNGKTIKCQFCSKDFANIEECNFHISNVHKKDVIVEGCEAANVIQEPQAIESASVQPEPPKEALPCEDVVPTEVVNIDSAGALGVAQINTGFQTISVNLEDIQMLNPGVFSNLVQDVTVPDNFQLAPHASSVIEENHANQVLLYNVTPQSMDNIPEDTDAVLNSTETVFQPTEILSEPKNIFNDASILCILCNQMFTNYALFQQHACKEDFSDKNAVALTEEEIEERIHEIEQTLGILEEENTASKDQLRDLGKIEPCKIFQCPACNKAFKSRLAFKKHIKMHSCWECHRCKKVLVGKNAYLEHVQTHKDSKMMSCRYCKKLFKKPSDLARHHRTHTGEKPFSCNICYKKFTLRATLKSHLRTHDPDHKQYSCDICDALYSSKASLKMHMTIHTGVRQYKCPICKAEFRTPSAKKAHMTIGHRTVQKTKTKKRNKIANILRTASNKLLQQNLQDIQKEVSEYVTYEEMPAGIDQGHIIAQTETMDLTSQITNLNLPAETILSTIQDGEITVDPSLLQQLQMSNLVLTTNPEPEPGPSIILDEVSSFLNLNPETNNIQIVSMPENDEGGVTISIKEKILTAPRKAKSEKSKQAAQCDLCLRILASKDGLRKHKKNVHGHKRKYSCFKCDDKFDTKEQLAVHEKIHLAPFSCPICALPFDDEDSLGEHLYSIHGVEPPNEEPFSLFNLKLATLEDPVLNKYEVAYFN